MTNEAHVGGDCESVACGASALDATSARCQPADPMAGTRFTGDAHGRVASTRGGQIHFNMPAKTTRHTASNAKMVPTVNAFLLTLGMSYTQNDTTKNVR